MPSEYTPTAEEVRRRWHDYWNLPGDPQKRAEYEGQFDRMLAQVRREAAAEELEEAANVYQSGQLTGMFMGRDDYPKAWLRARASETREGSK